MDNTDFVEIESTVNRLINGDESARKDLIQISYQRLKKLARKLLKDFPTVRRWADTDDVFQRAAMRLWQSLETVQPESSRHYFNLAALQVRRELIELARSFNGPEGLARNQESFPRGESEIDTDDQNEKASETFEASTLASWGEFHQKVEQLKDDEHEVFSLIWYQGLSQESVAKTLNVSQKTVSRRWQQARSNLFHLLDGQLPE